MKNLVILGSTGSIGTQTLEVVDNLFEWNILALTANNNSELLEKQVKKYNPKFIVIMNEKLANKMRKKFSQSKIEVLLGMKGLEYVAGLSQADFVINALVGAVGLKPSISALKANNQLGLANKESMVIGGEIINNIISKNYERDSIPILPIDSEHNAIFNILNGHDNHIKNIWLTASGGPFWDYTAEDLENVTVAEALNHPNWDMGNKITIDSATLMNKGLEVIEAHWLFNQPYQNIKVVIHPESIIHSMVEYTNNSFQAELGASDMRIPIQNVLTYPELEAGPGQRLNLFEIDKLSFQKPDLKKFPLLKLAYEAGQKGGSMPVVLNAANEIAVDLFLNKKISFIQIPQIVEKVLTKHEQVTKLEPDHIFEIDNWARSKAKEVYSEC